MFLALAVVLILASGLLERTGLTGARAMDGDSLRSGGEEFRLHGIDAPEYDQMCDDSSGASYPCGRRARDHLAGLLRNGDLACRTVDVDRYGRTVAVCRAGDVELNRAMVEAGWAVAYNIHTMAYAAAEAGARLAGRGIWQGSFVRPEDWRAQHRATLAGGSDAPD